MPSAMVCSQPNRAADAGGTETILNAAGDLAFQPDEEDGGRRHEGHQQDRFHDGEEAIATSSSCDDNHSVTVGDLHAGEQASGRSRHR